MILLLLQAVLAATAINGQFVFKFNDEAKSRSDAEQECKKWGGNLATISSEMQNNYFKSELNNRELTSAWIGLSDKGKEGEFKWASLVPHSSYTNWRIKGVGGPEPNGGTGENCVEIIPGPKYSRENWDGTWNDTPCSAKMPFICERSQFEFNDEAKSWSDAEQECKKWGGNLATITSEKQNNYFKSELNSRELISAWIGLNDKGKEGEFKWASLVPHSSYTNWRIKGVGGPEPNGDKVENCVEIIPGPKYSRENWDGTWNDTPCGAKMPFICERNQ